MWPFSQKCVTFLNKFMSFFGQISTLYAYALVRSYHRRSDLTKLVVRALGNPFLDGPVHGRVHGPEDEAGEQELLVADCSSLTPF